ncbi:MAG: hypothetical protein B7Z37_23520 [Verrucomicrobia bacterium 12-59-8]|nr:MAG: hypothetical protein B7Z37_23520 [Verrucomicrobia bacterium 12-59-8]
MHTYNGKRVYPLDLKEEDIDINVIAHSLALQNRYLGHTIFPYSVAQHSWLMSYEVPEEYAFEALMHDVAEVYCGDMIRPIKYHPKMAAFKDIERNIDVVFRKRFGLPEEMSQVIKEADTRMAWTERRDVLFPSHADWGPAIEPYSTKIKPLDWMGAKIKFLNRFNQLTLPA